VIQSAEQQDGRSGGSTAYLTVTGELRAPRIEGELAVSTGRINLDPLLANTGGGGYSTKPTEFATSATPAPAVPTEGQTPGFAGITARSTPHGADDLVVKSDNLQTASSPIGLGAMNVTLGGDLRATKAPNQQLRLAGRVNAVRGTYQFQGRSSRFSVTASFASTAIRLDQLNPALDLKTQRIIQGVETKCRYSRHAEQPRIELTSVRRSSAVTSCPLIVFNQPVNQLGEGQQISLNQRAEQPLADLLPMVSARRRAVGRRLNLKFS